MRSAPVAKAEESEELATQMSFSCDKSRIQQNARHPTWRLWVFCQIANLEICIREPKTKREEWLSRVLYIAAVADEDTFLVQYLLSIAIRIVAGKRWVVFSLFLEGSYH